MAFDFAAARQADQARSEELWTQSKITIALDEAIKARDVEAIAEAYRQSSMFYAHMTQTEIDARDERSRAD